MNPPPFILVHGAWHAGSCWHRLAPLIAAAGHAVNTPDLPGHGASAVPLARASMKTYVAALVALLDTLDEPCVLVGHSMAGMAVAAAAAQRPGRIARLVFLCAYLPRDGDSVFGLIESNRADEPPTPIERALRMSADKRRCDIEPDAIVPLFYPLAPAEVAAAARAAFGTQATLPLAARLSLDEAALARVPSTYVACTHDAVIPVRHQRRMLARRPCDELLQLEADHSPFLSCPAELAALLLASVAS